MSKNYWNQDSKHYQRLKLDQIGNLKRILSGFMFTEGPVWNHEKGYLLFSDIPGNKIFRLYFPNHLEVLRTPTYNANGLAFDHNGCLLAAEHGSRTVTRMYKDGRVETIANNYMGKKLHSPNDIAVHSDGSFYFTDPPFGLGNRQPELDFMGVYRYTTGGKLVLVEKINEYPNGLAFSPDEKTLYLALTATDKILAYDVMEDGMLDNRRHFADVPHPDGIAIDIAGNVYVAGWDGVAIIEPDGTPVGTIQMDIPPANLCFGGEDGKILIMTARELVYTVDVPIPGRIIP